MEDQRVEILELLRDTINSDLGKKVEDIYTDYKDCMITSRETFNRTTVADRATPLEA